MKVFLGILLVEFHLLFAGTSARIFLSEEDANVKSTSNCAQQSTGKSVVCNYWPDANSLNRDITTLTITMANLNTVNQQMISTLNLNMITELRLTKCSISQVSNDALKDLSRLTEVSFNSNRLKSVPVTLFATNNKLTKIDLSNNNLEALDNTMFQNLRNLVFLDLSGNRLTNFPANLPPTLVHLNLEKNYLSRVVSSNKLTRLEYLNLCQNEKNIIFDLNAIGCSKLNNLCLDDDAIRKVHTELSNLSDLQELTIKGQKTRNARLAMEPLESIKVCTKLQKLKIERCDLASLSVLTPFSDLTALQLKEVFVEQKPSVSDFEGCSNLETLDLTGSQNLARSILGNQEILKKLPKVRTLVLKDCNLENLNWIPNKGTGGTTVSINIFPQLYSVDISGNNNFDCQDKNAKKALCRFDNLKRAEVPDWKIVNKEPKLILENSNSTNCQQTQTMSTNSVQQLSFSDCGDIEIDITTPEDRIVQHPTEKTELISDSTDSVTDANFQPKDDENPGPSTVVIVVCVLIIILAILMIVLAVFIYYRRRNKCRQLQLQAPSSMQGIENPQSTQSKV